MELSLYLAKVFGIFFLIGGLAVLINKKAYMKADEKLLKDKPLALVLGMMLMLASLLLILKHNVWEMGYVGLITLIGWIVFIKGAIIVLIPDLLDVLKKKTFGDGWYWIGGILWLIVGLYLSYIGFFA